MNRRDFSLSLLGAALAGGASERVALGNTSHQPKAVSSASETPFALSVMLWTVFRDLPFEQRLEKVAEAGYANVELVNEFRNWSDADFARVNRKKRALGIAFDATAGVDHGAADPSERDAFLVDIDSSSIIVLSGNRIEGSARRTQHQACVDNLKRAAELAERKDVTLLLENIDPEENPNYFLTSVAEGLQIVSEVNHPSVRFLYDFYHEQIAEGNLIEKLERHIARIGVVHIADVPGRHEPGTGEINYQNIFRKLAALNFKGVAAMEFLPTGYPAASLRKARQMVSHSIHS